jgi:riboflavin kinase/FMN adenylyltransferase
VSIIGSLDDLPGDIEHAAVSIGMFDGVHLGHQALLAVLRSEAERISGPSIALTFDRHPLELVAPDRAPLYIDTVDQKAKLIENTGVDIVVVASFNHELADLTPQEFADKILVSKLKAAAVVVGTNFKFGRRRSGDVDTLRELGAERDFRVVGVEPIVIAGAKVSSTRIRHTIEKGDVESAARLLGRSFRLQGRVVSGRQLGRKLGFPTANIDVGPRQVVPGNGVYAVCVFVEGKNRPGVCNIGNRPTVDGETKTIEVHIDGFTGNIYDKEIGVEFHCRLRDEVRFESLEILSAQIAKDVEVARGCLS